MNKNYLQCNLGLFLTSPLFLSTPLRKKFASDAPAGQRIIHFVYIL
jgi:hypothetical protein